MDLGERIYHENTNLLFPRECVATTKRKRQAKSNNGGDGSTSNGSNGEDGSTNDGTNGGDGSTDDSTNGGDGTTDDGTNGGDGSTDDGTDGGDGYESTDGGDDGSGSIDVGTDGEGSGDVSIQVDLERSRVMNCVHGMRIAGFWDYQYKLPASCSRVKCSDDTLPDLSLANITSNWNKKTKTFQHKIRCLDLLKT